MSDVEERQIGELTVRIDRLLCVGFGDCIEEAPATFEFDDEGIATFQEMAEEPDESTVMEACRACPVDALTVFDEEGAQIVP